MNDSVSDKEKWAYAAGLIDADGCLSLVRRTGRLHATPRISFVNTNESVVGWLANQLGVKSYTMTMPNSRKNLKKLYQLQIEKRSKIQAILERLSPYLVVKKRKAEIITEFYSLHEWGQGMRKPLLPKEEKLFKEMKLLNKRGISG